jgi:hypothetical protein
VTLKLIIGRFHLELVLDRFVLLYVLGAGTAIMTAVSTVRL